MIRVKIECIPFGEEAQKSTIGEITIINDGTHPNRPQYGNYKVRVSDVKNAPTEFELKHHFRDCGFWTLLSRIIRKYIACKEIKNEWVVKYE